MDGKDLSLLTSRRRDKARVRMIAIDDRKIWGIYINLNKQRVVVSGMTNYQLVLTTDQ
jgi:hypothetical protein